MEKNVDEVISRKRQQQDLQLTLWRVAMLQNLVSQCGESYLIDEMWLQVSQ